MTLARPAGAVLVLEAAFALALAAQQRGLDLTVENLMRGPALYGSPPALVRFSDDSRYVYFRWQPPGDTAQASWRVSVTGGDP